MSTEARRASLPPHLRTPPRPQTPPHHPEIPPRPEAPPRTDPGPPGADGTPRPDAAGPPVSGAAWGSDAAPGPESSDRSGSAPDPATSSGRAVPPRPAREPAPGPDSAPGVGGASRPASGPRPDDASGPRTSAGAQAAPRPASGPGPDVSFTAAVPRSPVPPHPGTPPRPAVPPRPAQAPAGERGEAAEPGAPGRTGGAGTPASTAGRDGRDGRGTSTAPDDGRDGNGTGPGARTRYPRFRLGDSRAADSAPPPSPSARFPDVAPTVGRDAPRGDGAAQATSRRPGAPAQTPTETTARLRPIPAAPHAETAAGTDVPAPRAAVPPPGPAAPRTPDPALSWSTPYEARPRVSFGEPEGYDGLARPRPLGGRPRPQVVAAAVCLVLGVGLLTGAVTGSWLAGDSGDDGARSAYTEAGDLWHSVPVDQLFPPTVQGKGAGPGGADRTWTRVAVAPDGDCAGAFDRLLAKVLDPVGCSRLLRATYTDATQSHVTTVGLLFTKADAAAMTSLAGRFEKEGLGRRDDLMPLPYQAKDTVAEGFGAPQRGSWTVSVLTDAPVVVYAVSGWADGRTVDEPEPAEEAIESGAASAPAQAGLGHEAKGLADRVERALRRHVGAPTEQPS
ncbi:hypothetical protein GCM10010348_37190 [Streptomyces anthocyanicus]|nr:hypothetical protein GCM10010391_23930 [Streptomyces anthocyanicus]GHC11070.1 hypothetical protein GCM10010348_37190 [Streptomyces anthocyanicus]